MKNKVTLVSLLALMLSSFFVTSQAIAAGAFHKGTVSRIYISGSGTVLVKIKDQLSGCVPTHGNHYYSLATTHAGFDATYALILAAANTGSAVSLKIDDAACTDSSINNTSISYVIQDF